ncbi:MAG: glycine-rich domain-containing protein [Candidatus Paceibacterota bacterium]
MKKNKKIQIIKVLVLSLILSAGIGFVFSANILPLNVGSSNQVKIGGLDINGYLKVSGFNSGFVAVGPSQLKNGANLNKTPGATSAAYIRSANGFSTPNTPDYTFYGDIDTGMYSPTPGNILAFSTGGIEKIRLTGSSTILSYLKHIPVTGNKTNLCATQNGQLKVCSTVPGCRTFQASSQNFTFNLKNSRPVAYYNGPISKITIKAIGGGGGGSGGVGGNTNYGKKGGNGGGGGGYAKASYAVCDTCAINQSSTLTVSVGSGGSNGFCGVTGVNGSCTPGENGQPSVVKKGVVTLVAVNGGTGSQTDPSYNNPSSGAGGVGGTGSFSNTNNYINNPPGIALKGGDGASGGYFTWENNCNFGAGGGGGGSAGGSNTPTSNGLNGTRGGSNGSHEDCEPSGYVSPTSAGNGGSGGQGLPGWFGNSGAGNGGNGDAGGVSESTPNGQQYIQYGNDGMTYGGGGGGGGGGYQGDTLGSPGGKGGDGLVEICWE